MENQLFDDMGQLIADMQGNRTTKENVQKIFFAFSDQSVFGRKEIMNIIGITQNPAGVLIKKMLKEGMIVAVKGEDKGKYRFKK